MGKPKTKPKAAKVKVNLDLGAFTFHPGRRREDGGMKSRATMTIAAVHRDTPVRDLMEFLVVATGALAIVVDVPDFVPEVDPWKGFGEIRSVKLVPPGQRSEEQGKDEHPTVTLALEIQAGSATNLQDLMALRLEMDDAGAFDALVTFQVWQEDLPWEKDDKAEESASGSTLAVVK